MTSYEPPHLRSLRSWDSEIPRFLFRGFNQYSGGNKELNTPTAITPHAFLAKSVGIKIDKSFGYDPRRKSSFSGPMALNAMSLDQFRYEINGHLSGSKDIVSHFSSWTADFQLATRYAWGGNSPPNRHIGILDTRASRREHRNAILHVRALRYETHTRFKFDYEYLVYGPVTGLSYTCLAISRPQSTLLCPALHPPLYPDWSKWPVIRMFRPFSQIRKAYNRAARHSFYHDVGTGYEACWGSCTDTALYLTIIAAEWSRYGWRDFGYLAASDSPGFEIRWQLVVSDLSQVMEWAARDATLVLPLVNPNTWHQAAFEDLDMMLGLLSKFEAEIIRIRSKPPPEPWSLTRYLWGQA